MKTCTGLSYFICGSPQLTNESAPALAQILRLLPKLEKVGFRGQMDDDGFLKLAAVLCDMADRLEQLQIHWTRVSPALLSKTLLSLPNLTGIFLIRNPIGDDGFRQVASSLQQLHSLKHLHLCDIGVTWRTLLKLEEVLLSCPKVRKCHLYAERKSFPPPGEDIAKVPSLTTLPLIWKRTLNEPALSYGCHVTDSLLFRNERLQALNLKFFV